MMLEQGAPLLTLEQAVRQTPTLPDAFEALLNSLAGWRGEGVADPHAIIGDRRRKPQTALTPILSSVDQQIHHLEGNSLFAGFSENDLLLLLLSMRAPGLCTVCGGPSGDVWHPTMSQPDQAKEILDLYLNNRIARVCGFCYCTKGALSTAMFVQWARNVIGFQDHSIAATMPIALRKWPARWMMYNLKALGRGIAMLITEQQFNQMVKLPCFHCGFATDPNGCGLDRVDDEPEFRPDNTAPSCRVCHRAKKYASCEILYDKARMIVAVADGQ
jgi:hypothetical protein